MWENNKLTYFWDVQKCVVLTENMHWNLYTSTFKIAHTLNSCVSFKVLLTTHGKRFFIGYYNIFFSNIMSYSA